MNKQKGFTIIELIVVIAIIAVLAAIVLVNITSYINKGRDGRIIEELHAVQSDVMSSYIGDSGLKITTTAPCSGIAAWTDITTTLGATGTCASAGTTGTPTSTWCACAVSKSDSTKYSCVDATHSTVNQTFPATGLTTCALICATANSFACP